MRTEIGAKYRWLAVGDRVRYVGREGRPGLRGREGTVLAVPPYAGIAPKNVAVRLEATAELLASGCIAPAGVWRRAG